MLSISQEQMSSILDTCYSKALNGLPNSKSVKDLAEGYLAKYSSRQIAAEKLAANQIVKCGTSGFITGLGGMITLPVAVPANIGSVLYVQLRMVASIAYIGGYNPKEDAVQTFAFLCLTGSSMGDIVKSVGTQIGEKLSISLIKKIPGKILISINRKVGFRLVTKFGEKGVINLVKFVPFAGGFIGGGIDIASTKIIARNAISLFIKEDCI